MSDVYTQVVQIGTGDRRNTQPVTTANPLPVQLIAGGGGGVVVAATVRENSAVTVTGTRVLLVAANPARIGLRFCNVGTDPVAIGSGTITWATRVLVLANGDFCSEGSATGDAPGLAWYGICDTGKSASVTVQEVLS